MNKNLRTPLLIGLVFCPAVLSCFSGILLANEGPKKAPGEISIEEFLQQLSSVPFVLNKRDPFSKQLPPFEIAKSESEGSRKFSILERFPLKDYQVVAILVGDVYPRALIRVPAENKILIVREKDHLGNRGGVIKKIQKDNLLVEENKKNEAGFVDHAEVVLGIQPAAGSSGTGKWGKNEKNK